MKVRKIYSTPRMNVIDIDMENMIATSSMDKDTTGTVVNGSDFQTKKKGLPWEDYMQE